jgi:hypothetical protein
MSYQFIDEELQRHLNQAFINTINGLAHEKFITAKQCNEICTNYSIVIEKRNWLPRTLSKWLGLDDGKVFYRLVKAVNRKKDEHHADAD